VLGQLTSAEHAPAYVNKLRAEQVHARETFTGGQSVPLVSLEQARNGAIPLSFSADSMVTPPFVGARVQRDIPLESIVPYIDWTPFFHAWELKGKYPDILNKPGVGEAAREVFEAAQTMLANVVAKKRFSAHAAWGLFPANRQGDDIHLFSDRERSQTLKILPMLRQQQARGGEHFLSLADFIATEEAGADVLGMFAVYVGGGLDEYVRGLEKAGDDYDAIMAKVLADRLAEALAEKLHHDVRVACAIEKPDELSVADMITEKYHSIRPAPGYPACPDHTDKRDIFALLVVEQNIGLSLTESCAMLPASSVSGFYFFHPSARYFTLGKIGKDQVHDYAERKGMSVAEVERWLAPVLAYTPTIAIS